MNNNKFSLRSLLALIMITVMIAVGSVFSFVGCGDDEKKDDKKPPQGDQGGEDDDGDDTVITDPDGQDDEHTKRH